MNNNNPWIGLTPHYEEDNNVFVGRDRHVKALLDNILQNHFCVLYGPSGIGKTSLINAGLIPIIKEKGLLPICVRLIDREDNYSAQIIHSIGHSIECHNVELKRDALVHENVSSSLVDFFKGLHLISGDGKELTPLIILDEVDEVIYSIKSSKKRYQSLHTLFEDLAQIIDANPTSKENKKKKNIFISYKHDDLNKVKSLKERIERLTNINCWMDEEGIESDAQFAEVIINAIDEADVFLFISSESHTSIKDYKKDWTVRELNYAQDQNKRIVFVNIDGTPLTKWFKFMFPQQQIVDALSDNSFNRLISDLQKWIHPEYEPTNNKSTLIQEFSCRLNLLISIGENYLTKFDQFLSNITTFKNNRYYLGGFNEAEASEVIQRYPIIKEKETADYIVDKITQCFNPELGYEGSIEINPVLLSLFMNLLQFKCSETGQDSRQIIDSFNPIDGINDVIAHYYSNCTKGISPKALAKLESLLVNSDGFRVRISYHQLLRSAIKDIYIRVLQESRILKFITFHDELYVELVHDLFSSYIHEKNKSKSSPISALSKLFR